MADASVAVIHDSLLELSFQTAQEQKTLRSLIYGKRVLILGAGHSAHDLAQIPEDVVVLSCNMGPLMLLEKGFEPRVDLYVVNRAAFKNYGDPIVAMLWELSIGVLLSREPEYIVQFGETIHYEHLFHDRTTRSTFYLEDLVSPNPVSSILEKDDTLFTSTGVALLQYALFFEASEVYLVGIDLDVDVRGHVLVPSKAPGYHYHKGPDRKFFAWMMDHYRNVFSISASSPIATLVPVRPLV